MNVPRMSSVYYIKNTRKSVMPVLNTHTAILIIHDATASQERQRDREIERQRERVRDGGARTPMPR